MRRTIRTLAVLAAGLWVGVAAHQVLAYPDLALKTKAACTACHANPGGGAELTDAGKAYKSDAAKAPPADVKGSDYVGVNKCKMCHLAQYKAWQGTKHGSAFAGLEKADSTAAAEMAAKLKLELKEAPAKTDGCVKCHVTGFRLPGGYPAADSAKTAAVVNVGCESCHGPGSLHVTAPKAEKKSKINNGVSENMCRQCHTPETSPSFKYEEYKAKGAHPVAKS